MIRTENVQSGESRGTKENLDGSERTKWAGNRAINESPQIRVEGKRVEEGKERKQKVQILGAHVDWNVSIVA